MADAGTPAAPAPLLSVRGVAKVFASGGWLGRGRGFTAVDDVGFDLAPGETLGIVGESGSGKSTLLRIVLGLVRPTAGEVIFEGRALPVRSARAMRPIRRRMQAVFQDTGSSFNPRQTVWRAVSAPLEVHGLGDARTRADRVAETLALVGLGPAFHARYPHQLSGGQRQRVAIARAIVMRPSLVVADEPTSALDVSVQAQILNLFRRTREELGLTYLFVTHNLGVVRAVADRVAVMRQGRIVEQGPAAALFAAPQHEYTRALLAAVPDVDHALARGIPSDETRPTLPPGESLPRERPT